MSETYKMFAHCYYHQTPGKELVAVCWGCGSPMEWNRSRATYHCRICDRSSIAFDFKWIDKPPCQICEGTWIS